MDPKEKDFDADAALAELRESLRDLDNNTLNNTGAVTGSYGYDSMLSADTVTLNGISPYSNTVTSGGFTLGSTYLAPGYTTSATGINWNATTASITANPWATTTSGGRMELNGDNADLVINGVSLLEVLKDRLNVMIPNPELEKEWNELKALGDRYRELEAKLKEQGEMWAKLKQTPPDVY